MKHRVTIKACMERPAWEIAETLGIGYSGDCSPVPHGGVFYSRHDWNCGYADAVEIWDDPDSDRVCVSIGIINKLEGADMDSAFDCIGIDVDDPLRANVDCQIDACRSYGGIEPDMHIQPRSFHVDREWSLWRYARPHIEALCEVPNISTGIRFSL